MFLAGSRQTEADPPMTERQQILQQRFRHQIAVERDGRHIRILHRATEQNLRNLLLSENQLQNRIRFESAVAEVKKAGQPRQDRVDPALHHVAGSLRSRWKERHRGESAPPRLPGETVVIPLRHRPGNALRRIVLLKPARQNDADAGEPLLPGGADQITAAVLPPPQQPFGGELFIRLVNGSAADSIACRHLPLRRKRASLRKGTAPPPQKLSQPVTELSRGTAPPPLFQYQIELRKDPFHVSPSQNHAEYRLI